MHTASRAPRANAVILRWFNGIGRERQRELELRHGGWKTGMKLLLRFFGWMFAVGTVVFLVGVSASPG